MCNDCNSKLPKEIKFELWRPEPDWFKTVLAYAHKFIKDKGQELDELNLPVVGNPFD